MLDQRIAALRDPACYPDAGQVEIIQTHISIVCLAGDRVYKLKKPVALPFVDFSTLELRERACRDELRLNRRLCPDVYLEVVALRRAEDRVAFFGDGEIVDWAVCMARLPADRMLDRMLANGTVTELHADTIARLVAEFHSRADRGPDVDRDGAPTKLAGFAHANFTETEPLVGRLWHPVLHRALRALTERDFAELTPVLERRLREGRVVEGHGDLHARNICMTDPPSIYDCVEFSREFRCGDVATENAFLVMDLNYRGARHLAGRYLDTYVEATGDPELPAILPPLVRYRAMVRAKTSGFVSLDPSIPENDRDAAADSSRRHVRLAAASAVEQAGAILIAACGLPASGKSFVLERLAAELGWPYVSTDQVRKELAGLTADATAPELYTDTAKAAVYSAVFERAREASRRGLPIVLDANFANPARRAQCGELAVELGARHVFSWFDVDESTARQRLAKRAGDKAEFSDADQAVYDGLRARFEPPSDEPHVRIDGAESADDCAARLLAALLDS